MTQSNSSILSDVSTCLHDAMDTVFNNEPCIIVPEDNNKGSLSAEDLKLMMNKRKLASAVATNGEQQNQENGNDSAKRLRTTNGHHPHEQKT